jgi:hypothetical protein
VKYQLYGLCLTVFIILLGSCEAAESFFEQPPHKTIVVTDSDAAYPARISDINNKTILLALSSGKPDPNNIDINTLMDSVYTIGRVTRNKINLKLYSGAADYWTGSGYYWILFVLPDGRAEHISLGYISKQPHNFYAENTYLNNIDFMPPIDLNLDISSVLPF